MASINLSGVLRRPLGEWSWKNKVYFTHVDTTGQTLAGTRTPMTVDEDGAYNVDLEYGNVLISTYDIYNQVWVQHGPVTVNSNTPATDLPTLIGITTPVTDAQLLIIQALVEDANQSAIAAAASAQAAQDAVNSIDALAVAKMLNVSDDSVIYSDDTATLLDNIVAIYDEAQSIAYMLDDKADAGELIVSLSGNVLTTTNQTLYLRVMPSVDAKEINPDVRVSFNDSVDAQAGYGGVTFSRASSTGNVNKSGVLVDLAVDEPAITATGLSSYEPVTNRIINSKTLTAANSNVSLQSAGTGSAPVNTASGVLDPMLTNTAESYTLDLNGGVTTSDQSSIKFIYIPTVGGPSSFSFWMKSNTAVNYDFRLSFNGSGGGVMTASQSWKRHTINFDNIDNTARVAVLRLRGGLGTSDSADISIWQAQETGTSYQFPDVFTGAVAGTRAADIASIPVMNNMPAKGLPFSILIDCEVANDNLYGAIWRIDAAGEFSLRRVGNDMARVRIADESGVDVSLRFPLPVTRSRVGVVYNGSEIIVYVDGTEVGSSPMPTITTPGYAGAYSSIHIGNSRGASHANGEVANFEIYHSALTSEVISLKGGAE